jgi:hypothetical protein
MSRLIPCPSCGTHVKRGETRCPHCDATVRADGNAARTAVALALGLTAASSAGVNCGEAGADYGISCTTDPCLGRYDVPASPSRETSSGGGGQGGSSDQGGAPSDGGGTSTTRGTPPSTGGGPASGGASSQGGGT